MKNILITGGSGFIGSNLSIALIKKGYTVTVLDNLSEQIHGSDPETTSPLYISIKDKVNFIKGSVTNREIFARAIKNQDVIVHLAAETGTGQSMYQISHYTQINIGGTSIMLDLLANTKHAVKKVLIASSRAIYGEGRYLSKKAGFIYPETRSAEDMAAGDFEVKYPGTGKLTLVATDEDSKAHPSSIYGITKLTQEQMVMTFCPMINVAPVALRYQNVYGPGQSLSNPYTGLLSIFSTLLKNGKELNIFEDGKESRDFVFISDVIKATVAGIEMDEANNQVFNVGSGIATDVLTVANLLIKYYHSSTKPNISGNFRKGDIRHNYADLTKIRAILHYEPTVMFEEGIKRFSDWVNNQEINESGYEQSLTEMKEKGIFK